MTSDEPIAASPDENFVHEVMRGPVTVNANEKEISLDNNEKQGVPESTSDRSNAEDTPSAPNQVTPNSEPRSPPKSSIRRNLDHDFLPTVTRGRVFSLDRGRDLLTSLEFEKDNAVNTASILGREKTPKKQNGSGIITSQSYSPGDDDEADDRSFESHSSDGESSYFAKNLPSPRSGRRFSYDAGSISSAPARSGFYQSSASINRESDASLSLSDDDSDTDEDQRALGTHLMLPPPVGKKLMETSPLYPQRITRMHSASSLVSSGSDVDAESEIKPKNDPDQRTGESPGSSSGSSRQSSNLTESPPNSSHEMPPTNSVKEVGGDTAGPHPSFLFSGSDVTQPYPSTFLQADGANPENRRGVLQPPSTSYEHFPAWAPSQLGSQSHAVFFPRGAGAYGLTNAPAGGHPCDDEHPSHGPALSSDMDSGELSRSAGDTSHVTVPMVYSEDDEMDENHNRLASGFEGVDSQAPFASNYDPGISFHEIGHSGYGQPRNIAPPASEHVTSTERAATGLSASPKGDDEGTSDTSTGKGFRVYWQRWIMLMYMSVLNLLSDWTCYSVAPIAVLTAEAFGRIDPEQLVVVFLGANAVATACEPIVLSRLGLRRTVLLGALLLMTGSIVKSGGLPPIIESGLEKGHGEWRVYLGFFLVGLSQPLYQCTPALLSASWFPERERTMATGVALNANQLGIGFAFIFGTLLVATSDDIVKYFGLLSIISSLTFIGCLIQFDDAPPTPPSDTARVMRGDLQLNLPDVDTIWRSVRSLGASGREFKDDLNKTNTGQSAKGMGPLASQRAAPKRNVTSRSSQETDRSQGLNRASRSSKSMNRKVASKRQTTRETDTGSLSSGSGARRRSSANSRNQSAAADSGLGGMTSAPAPAPSESPTDTLFEMLQFDVESRSNSVFPPSCMMPGPVGPPPADREGGQEESLFYDESNYPGEQPSTEPQGPHIPPAVYPGPYMPMASVPTPNMPYQQPFPPPQWHHQQNSYAAGPGFYHPSFHPQSGYRQQHPGPYESQGYYYYPQGPYYPPQMYPPPHPYGGYPYGTYFDRASFDEGAEPVVKISPHHLDIEIRDDQIILSARACLSRPGFVHALVSFTVSGIVINTLSTFMDYLVRLNGAGREYVGIVGGSFQFVIMISSLIIGKQTDRTRAYYSVTVGMLVLGAFALAECGVDLDADRGGDLRWALIIVACLVGPLQPVSTELGVEVAYPLSENTVLVIQQLFSNLLSALFIPFFKALKDVGREALEDAEQYEKPEYTFSFYLLIVLHATATVFFATFNGRYLRYDHEQEKKALNEQKNAMGDEGWNQRQSQIESDEGQPLLNQVV